MSENLRVKINEETLQNIMVFRSRCSEEGDHINKSDNY